MVLQAAHYFSGCGYRDLYIPTGHLAYETLHSEVDLQFPGLGGGGGKQFPCPFSGFFLTVTCSQ